MTMAKDSFIIYKSFYKPISRLSDKQLGRLFRAIFKYQLGEEVTVEEDIEMAFGFFINQFEIDETKYHGIVERNRNNGRKGGAPIGNSNAKSKQPKQPSGLNSTQTTQNKPNENDNENDIDKESPNGDKKEAEPSSLASSNPDFIKFNNWLKRKAPFCSNPKNFSSQITEAEFLRLKEKYTGKQIADIIEQIENRKDLRKRYTNLYRTVLNWAKREYGS